MGPHLDSRMLERSYRALVVTTLHMQVPEEKMHICLLNMLAVVYIVWYCAMHMPE